MFARRGFHLRNPIPCDPIPAQGQLDFFKWKPSGGTIIEPARWMRPKDTILPIPEEPPRLL